METVMGDDRTSSIGEIGSPMIRAVPGRLVRLPIGPLPIGVLSFLKESQENTLPAASLAPAEILLAFWRTLALESMHRSPNLSMVRRDDSVLIAGTAPWT
jgi:hypothetical protein